MEGLRLETLVIFYRQKNKRVSGSDEYYENLALSFCSL